MDPLNIVLNCPRCIISVVGDHAGEEPAKIFARKSDDIKKVGRTFWCYLSRSANPVQVQQLCADGAAYALFVKPFAKGGARPTTNSDPSREYNYSPDPSHPNHPAPNEWLRLPKGLGAVTGNLDAQAFALVFDELQIVEDGMLDLWNYGQFQNGKNPVIFNQTCSTACAVRQDTSNHGAHMKSHEREIVAVAHLVTHYAVWLR